MTSSTKGRTIWEILTGKKKQPITPMELRFHNPLGAKVGCVVEFEHEAELQGIGFVIEKIVVYETRIGTKKFFHTDYCLKGVALDREKPIRFRLRLMDDEDATNELGCKLQLLQAYHEMPFDQGLYDLCVANGDNDPAFDEGGEKTFKVNYDDEGQELEVPRRYWRIGGEQLGPYEAWVTTLKDEDGNGTVEESELEKSRLSYFDFYRLTQDEGEQEVLEYLTIELNNLELPKSQRTFTLWRGPEIQAFQVRLT